MMEQTKATIQGTSDMDTMTKGQRAMTAVQAEDPFDSNRGLGQKIGTSRETVRRARFVRDHAPQLIDRVVDGTFTLHYAFKRAEGRPVIRSGPLPEVAKIVAHRHIADSGCWEWTGQTNGYGYGRVNLRGRVYYVHRLVYQLVTNEPIPAGLVIDHLCENPICFNPEHLEPVTQRENIRRSSKVGGKTRCRSGHTYTTETTYITSAGHRQCRICSRIKARKTNARRRQAIKTQQENARCP